MTRSPSTTSRAVSVTLEPTSPGSLSTVRTSSSATFSCLPPQRTIAYTRELSLSFALPSVPRNSGITTAGSLERAHGRPHMRAYSRRSRLPDVSAGTNPGRSAGLQPGRLRFPGCFRACGLIGWTIVHKIHPQAPINPDLCYSRSAGALVWRIGPVLRALGGAIRGGGHDLNPGRLGRWCLRGGWGFWGGRD